MRVRMLILHTDYELPVHCLLICRTYTRMCWMLTMMIQTFDPFSVCHWRLKSTMQLAPIPKFHLYTIVAKKKENCRFYQAHELWRSMLLIRKPYLLHVLLNCKICVWVYECVSVCVHHLCPMFPWKPWLLFVVYCFGARDIPQCRSMDIKLGKLVQQRLISAIKNRTAKKKIQNSWWVVCKQQRVPAAVTANNSECKSWCDAKQNKKWKKREKKRLNEWLNENWYYFVCVCVCLSVYVRELANGYWNAHQPILYSANKCKLCRTSYHRFTLSSV